MTSTGAQPVEAERQEVRIAVVMNGGVSLAIWISGVAMELHRIVQEALTNTLKHAGMTRATVALGYHGGFLELGIFDDGHGSAIDVVPGHGLVGMQQRAALLGGEFAAGPGPDGGFRVTARLPTEGQGP